MLSIRYTLMSSYSYHILLWHLSFKYKWWFSEAAVKVSGGAENVDHDLVISLLLEVVALLKDLLHDLKLIVKAEVILGCTLEVLAEIFGALLIVCVSFIGTGFISLFSD